MKASLNIDESLHLPIYFKRIIEDEEKIEKLRRTSESYVIEHPEEWGASWGKQPSTENSTQICDNIFNNKGGFEELEKRIERRIQDYYNYLGIDPQKSWVTHESWLNACKPGHFQECREHPFSIISGVFYIQTPNDREGRNFKIKNTLSFEWQFPTENDPGPLAQNKFLDPKEGDLILFPSNIEHEVTKNMSEDLRFSLAFNLTLEHLNFRKK